MMLPSIHFNGTSKEDLRKGYRAAYDAVSDAIDKLILTSPHGRDYYPQGDNAIVIAGAEHRARMDKLRSVLGELEALTLHTMA